MGRLTIPATLSSSLIMRLPGQYDQRSFAIIIMIVQLAGSKGELLQPRWIFGFHSLSGDIFVQKHSLLIRELNKKLNEF